MVKPPPSSSSPSVEVVTARLSSETGDLWRSTATSRCSTWPRSRHVTRQATARPWDRDLCLYSEYRILLIISLQSKPSFIIQSVKNCGSHNHPITSHPFSSLCFHYFSFPFLLLSISLFLSFPFPPIPYVIWLGDSWKQELKNAHCYYVTIVYSSENSWFVVTFLHAFCINVKGFMFIGYWLENVGAQLPSAPIEISQCSSQ